ncbi:MAG: hypothetical protein ACOC46_01115 [Pirellulales bacterium]
MSRRNCPLFLLAIAGALCAPAAAEPHAASFGSGQGSDPDAAENVLLLRGGRVLTGRVEPTGDGYVVRIGGGQLHVPADKVRLIAGSLEEAYELQRRQLVRRDPDEHLQLARWCLANGLTDPAREQLQAVLALEPQRTVARAMLQRLGPATRGEDAQRQPGAPDGAAGSLGSPRRSTQEAWLDKPAVAPPDGAQRHPAAQRRRAGRIPVGVLARRQFAASAQQVLVKNCGRSGCHDTTGAGKFALVPSRLRDGINRRRTEQNLEAVMPLVDRDHPATSRLLVAATRAHGPLDSPVFADRAHPEYRKLVAWVCAVSGKPEPHPKTAVVRASRRAATAIGPVQQPTANSTAPAQANPAAGISYDTKAAGAPTTRSAGSGAGISPAPTPGPRAAPAPAAGSPNVVLPRAAPTQTRRFVPEPGTRSLDVPPAQSLGIPPAPALQSPIVPPKIPRGQSLEIPPAGAVGLGTGAAGGHGGRPVLGPAFPVGTAGVNGTPARATATPDAPVTSGTPYRQQNPTNRSSPDLKSLFNPFDPNSFHQQFLEALSTPVRSK